jgi:hypothetical protein
MQRKTINPGLGTCTGDLQISPTPSAYMPAGKSLPTFKAVSFPTVRAMASTPYLPTVIARIAPDRNVRNRTKGPWLWAYFQMLAEDSGR